MENIKEKQVMKGVIITEKLNKIIKYNNLNFNSCFRSKLIESIEKGEIRLHNKTT